MRWWEGVGKDEMIQSFYSMSDHESLLVVWCAVCMIVLIVSICLDSVTSWDDLHVRAFDSLE